MEGKRYQISVSECDGESVLKIYEQIVETIDIKAIQNAINKKPRVRRKKGETDGK